MDETFRLYLMMTPKPSMIEAKMVLEENGYEVKPASLAELWGRYVGFDGRTRPTHNFETGEWIH